MTYSLIEYQEMIAYLQELPKSMDLKSKYDSIRLNIHINSEFMSEEEFQSFLILIGVLNGSIRNINSCRRHP